MIPRRYRRAQPLIQGYLRCRHIRQILSRPPQENALLAHLAGRTFLPRFRGILFDSPLQRLGEVVLVVLSRHTVTTRAGNAREVIHFRGYTASIDPDTAVTRWGPQSSVFAYDLSHRIRDNAVPPTLSAHSTALIRAALDLDHEIERQARSPFLLPGAPTLPPTLLAVPRGSAIAPQPTPTVLAHARDHRMPWRQAWHDLRRQWSVSQRTNHTELDLIDARLCPSLKPAKGWPGSLGEFHNMAKMIDRGMHNPARGVTLHPRTLDEEVVGILRRRLPPDIAQVCPSDELVRASCEPQTHLVLRGLGRLQVWQPTDAQDPACFIHEDAGHAADLWHVGSETVAGQYTSTLTKSAAEPPGTQDCAETAQDVLIAT